MAGLVHSVADMTFNVIRTRGLTRHFTTSKATVQAVQGIDLDVEQGELVALLGPNGAGKSTTLRMLTTLISPTSGSAQVAGFDVVTDQRAVRSRIGFIGQGNGAAHAQRGRDELIMQGRFYGMSKVDARSQADDLIASLDLSEVVDRPVSSLSGGQRRRLDIAMGLIHTPELLFLDEPSTGLDPQNRANLLEHIVALRQRYGTTVVLTTHYLDEADALAERVVVIDHGRIIADDTPHALKANLVGDRLAVTTVDAGDTSQVAARLAALAPGASVRIDGTTVEARVDGGPAYVATIAADLAADGVAVTGIESGRATLDDVFLQLTGRSLREGDASADAAITAETEEIAA